MLLKLVPIVLNILILWFSCHWFCMRGNFSSVSKMKYEVLLPMIIVGGGINLFFSLFGFYFPFFIVISWVLIAAIVVYFLYALYFWG